MEPKGTSKTEEVVLTYIGDVMNGVSDRDVSDLIDPFRYSSKEGKNVRRVERLSGYDRQEPEFELQSNILRSIKTSELYETNPAVAVDNSTLMVWKRTFYSIRLLSEVSQQDNYAINQQLLRRINS